MDEVNDVETLDKFFALNKAIRDGEESRNYAAWQRIRSRLTDSEIITAASRLGMVMPQPWTKEKPKVGGEYWCRNPNYPKTASVDTIKEDENGCMIWCNTLHDIDEWEPIANGLEWAGPIPQPSAPTVVMGPKGAE